MADNLTSEIATAILDHIHGVTPLVITLPLMLALTSDIPDVDNPGTEVVGGSYARQAITMAAAEGDTATNTSTVSVPMPTVVAQGFKIYDSSATPKAIWQGELSVERPFTAGDVAEFEPGDLVVKLR